MFWALCCGFLLFPWLSTTVSFSIQSWHLLLWQISASWDRQVVSTDLPALCSRTTVEHFFWSFFQLDWELKSVEGWREDERTLLRVVVSFCPWRFFPPFWFWHLLAMTTVSCLYKKHHLNGAIDLWISYKFVLWHYKWVYGHQRNKCYISSFSSLPKPATKFEWR